VTSAVLGEELPVADLVCIGVVLLPPRLLARVPGRLGQDERLGLRGGVLQDPEMVMVEDAQCFDGISDGDATIPDEQEVLSVLGIGRREKLYEPR
jgi:hypothetical protein